MNEWRGSPGSATLLGALPPRCSDRGARGRTASPEAVAPLPAPSRWLLLRGLGRERSHWFAFPPLLERGLGVSALAVDLPGSGERRHEPGPRTIEGIASDLARRLSAREPGPPWGVLGISLGGMVALSLAAQWRAGISHLVVINTSSRLSPAHRRLRPLACLALARAVSSADPLARERRIYSLATNAPAAAVARWARDAAELARRAPPRRTTLATQLLAAAAFTAPARLAQPLLVLGSLRDRWVSPSCSAALARRLGAPLRCHPSAGHDLPLEDPDWVIEQMRAWLRGEARA